MASGIAHLCSHAAIHWLGALAVPRAAGVRYVTAYHYVAAVALGSERLHAVLKKGDYVELAQSKHYADIEITVLSVP